MRRLRLSYYSDEDEEEHYNNQPQPQPQRSSPPTNPSPTNNQSHLSPLEISDDGDFVEVSDDDEEFIDVSENLPPPSPPPPPPAPHPDHHMPHPSTFGCPVGDFLQGLGLRLKREWLDSCVQGLERSVPGFDDLDVPVKAKLCFERFLVSDMNQFGGGLLPENVHSLHLVDLTGRYVLQVDEIVNISCPLKSRYQKAAPGIKRCLKLSMTDGVQRVFGMEYRPIKDLDALSPAGLKVVICNVHVRHGLLMLVPETFEVLGGLVEEMEAARQRLVDEVNKPPRGIRTRNRVVPPLRTRATLAAWPSGNDHVAGNNHTTTSDFRTPSQVHQAATYVAPGTDTSQRIEEEFPGLVNEEIYNRNPSANVVLDAEEFPDTYVAPANVAGQRIEEEFPGRVSGGNFIRNPSANVVFGEEGSPAPASAESAISKAPRSVAIGIEHLHMNAMCTNSTSAVRPPGQSSDVASVMDETDTDTVPPTMAYSASDPYLNDNDDIFMVEEVEHPLILSGAREPPFTYLASLSAKLATMKGSVHSVNGMIKCFLTGVKGFQYKERSSYDLRVYVDDGSLISQIRVHHNVVQKLIGHSPQEVIAALSSSDTGIVSNIKETLLNFQKFLASFEGKMLIEMHEKPQLPVALEMNVGCPESDALLLLRRVKSSFSSQTRRPLPADPIDLSP
ncbi:recQ-mediated genome instability protein 1 [Humulus lupulus]|uniref:recQ-mediated genome instability protein 1 n=1 Tax=Humulus lupulus TaxID=3486 RepID=UPI002B401FC2|nr:recQ-mediated genome instability protein 1 [Humulus lupulus]XP_062115893.1 recQ-mediated genome instability protein 1 [Humulus lupulus]XP_062115894.1 recQ-mediated genome instability protein 1 [Humulus lupulus]XP_062115895.1 recQ-mediated genome instability protein 1 [Humulus lupulus]